MNPSVPTCRCGKTAAWKLTRTGDPTPLCGPHLFKALAEIPRGVPFTLVALHGR